MKLVHINVRLAEGGASRVALTLHQAAISAGHDSVYMYAYGKGGGNSQASATVPRNARFSDRATSALNLLLHRVIGIDSFSSPTGMRRLSQVVRDADLIHLHAFHSHGSSPQRLFSVLSGKRVVWTHHDWWAVTGRCAIPGACTDWKKGCNPCSNLAAYPRSAFDFAASQKTRRQGLFSRHRNIKHVAPSSHLAATISAALGAEVTFINNSVDAELEQIARAGRNAPPATGRPRILVLANNLSDAEKTDRALVGSLIAARCCDIHTVGNNSPFDGPGVFNHGNVTSRRALAQIMTMCDSMLFTSMIDNAPLAIVEALCLGLPVQHVHSPASAEMLAPYRVRPLGTADDFAHDIRSGFMLSGWSKWSRPEISGLALQRFSVATMVANYQDVYDDLLLGRHEIGNSSPEIGKQ